MQTLELLAYYFIAINFVAFAAFGIDKARAEAAGPRRGKRRTPESDLLTLAFVGGTLGAYSGRAIFRHKTRKQPFSTQLHVIAIFQAAALVAWAIYTVP